MSCNRKIDVHLKASSKANMNTGHGRSTFTSGFHTWVEPFTKQRVTAQICKVSVAQSLHAISQPFLPTNTLKFHLLLRENTQVKSNRKHPFAAMKNQKDRDVVKVGFLERVPGLPPLAVKEFQSWVSCGHSSRSAYP